MNVLIVTSSGVLLEEQTQALFFCQPLDVTIMNRLKNPVTKIHFV